MTTKTSSPSTSDLPKSVKVGWRDYKIEPWSTPEAAMSRRYGETRHGTTTIKIDLGYGTRQAASTLLHELMHAAAAIWNYDDASKEESLVSALGDGLCTIWRDNPAVMHWIGWNIQHGT